MGSCGLEGVQGLFWHLGGWQGAADRGGDLMGTLSPQELALLTLRPIRSHSWMCCPLWKSAASSACLAYTPSFLAGFLPWFFKTKHNHGQGAGAHSRARTRGVAAPCYFLQGFRLCCACILISQILAFHQLLSLACSSFSAPFLYDLSLK